VLVPKDGKWIVLLCWQKISGGPVVPENPIRRGFAR
jgi:hypothetical protein